MTIFRHKLMCGTMTNAPYKESRMPPTPPSYPENDPPPCPRLYSSPVTTRKPSKASTGIIKMILIKCLYLISLMINKNNVIFYYRNV